jgi:uncharacterized protein YciI
MTTYFAVRRAPGAGWSGGVPLCTQPLWPEHAAFMDTLAAERFVVLGDPIGDDNEALLVVDAPSDAVVRARLSVDPRSTAEILVIRSIEAWTILLSSAATE